jgi:hypothetical protein
MEAKELKCGELRLNLGCGDDEMIGFIGIDKMEKSKANIIRDIEKHGLPFCDDSCVEIRIQGLGENKSYQ